MTAKYFAILTNYGAAQLANAVALGTQMNISAMAVGEGGGTLPVPDPAQTKLVRENRRAAVNQVSIDEKNPNFIIAEQVIPENEGGWWIREIGLFDDTGGLIAVGNAPETYKPNLQEGSGRTQVIQMVLMVSSTQAITLKVDPSVVLATREYVTKSIDAAIQASEDRAAQTYQPKGDYVTNPYLKIELLKKIDKVDITQQLGNDTGKVVSQNLLTTELGKKASVADVNSKMAKAQNGADIPDTEAFIKNLGLGDTDGFVGRLIKTRVFTSSDTYTPTPGTKRIRVTITGGGGGGGGCQAFASNETFFGAGGGAGGTIISIMTAGSYYVVIGAGGSGGAGALNGLNGGDSSFASLIASGGGGGGKSGVSNTSGGAGGVPNTGDIRIIGGYGGDGQSGNFSVSGEGGASHWGGGGRAGTGGGGVSGSAYGSGGGGAYDPAHSGTKMTGGNGAAGICIIEEFA